MQLGLRRRRRLGTTDANRWSDVTRCREEDARVLHAHHGLSICRLQGVDKLLLDVLKEMGNCETQLLPAEFDTVPVTLVMIGIVRERPEVGPQAARSHCMRG